jgi:succinate dehydrogenase / fumarate reductase cytochrome b subunit
MGWVGRFIRSSIGAKFVLAVTGILLFLFVVAHLLGNLQVFAGQDKLNHYAETLRSLGPLLLIARLGMVALTVVHVAAALRVHRQNEAARPIPYLKQASRQIRPQTRFMVTSGLVVLGYALFHLAHFTWGKVYPTYFNAVEKLADGSERHDVYAMLVLGFQVWWLSLVYLVAMFFLAFHLAHGLSSVPQTFGWNHGKYQLAFKLLGPVVAALIFLGYASIPVAVLIGRVGLVQ